MQRRHWQLGPGGVVARADEAKDRALQTRCEKAPANSPVGVRGGWGFFKR